LAVNLVKCLAKRDSSGHEVLGGLAVSALVVFAVKVDGVPLNGEYCFFFARSDCLAPDVSDVFSGVAADEYVVGVAEVACFGYEFVNYGVVYGAELFVVALT
jgi:hypothetical protein